MKSVKHIVLDYVEQALLKNNNQGLETKEIAGALNLQRTNVSTALNRLVKEGALLKSTTRPVKYFLNEQPQKSNLDFPILIGENGSLRTAVQLAQAAILYPNHALPVLVKSEEGAGRTYFMTKMAEFAIGHQQQATEKTIEKFNCKDYGADSEELDKLLFGSSERESIFDRSDFKVLLIDNIQTLSTAQQSKLISEMSRSTHQEGATPLIILGGNNQVSERLLAKLPIVIQLPDYKQRPLQEKLELLNYFFVIEAEKSSKDIQVSKEVAQQLLLSDKIHHIKQLEHAIRTACANAFVRSLRSDSQYLVIVIEDLPSSIQRTRYFEGKSVAKLDALMGTRNVLVYDQVQGLLDFSDSSSNDIYDKIESHYAQFEKRGLKQEDVQLMVQDYIKDVIDYDPLVHQNDDLSQLVQLESIVSKDIIYLVQDFVLEIQKELERQLASTAYYGISLHINALLSKSDQHIRKVDKDTILDTINNYPKEYDLCSRFARRLENHFNIELSIDETVILTMFIIEPQQKEAQAKPILLYVLHGRGVAKSLADFTRTLTKNQDVYGFDVLLEEKTEDSYAQLKQFVQGIDQGAGVIIIYDMGSVKTMCGKLQEETNIKLRTYEVPITMIGMSIARRCLIDGDVDSVFHDFMLDLNQFHKNREQEKVIITLCYTSEGGASQLKHYIDQYSKLGYRVIALSVANKEILLEEIITIRKNYQIHAFVGTFDPKIMGIPFIPLTSIFEHPKETLDRLLLFLPVNINARDYEKVYENMAEKFVYTSISKLKRVLPSVLDEFNFYYQLTEDQTIGLFMHLAALIERNASGESVAVKDAEMLDSLLDKFPEDYKNVRKIISPIERHFKLLIDDLEIAIIVQIVKKL